MNLRAALGPVLLAATLVVPQDARADRVVLSPLIPDRTVKAEEVADLFALFSSEMEFMPDVDEILEVNPRPPSLNTRCLESSRCLGAIIGEAGGETMLTGTVEKLGSDYVLELVYAEGSSIARRITYTVPTAPTPLVNAITPVLVEMLTGVSPQQEKAEAQMTGVSFDEDDDDFAFSASAPAPEPTPEPTYGARARDERIVAPPPPEPEPEPVVEDEFDPAAFDLGVGTIDDISFGEVSADEVEVVAAQPRSVRDYAEDEYYDEEPVQRLDLDDPETSSSRSADRGSSTRSTKKKSTPDGFDYKRVYITAKGGMSLYGIFTFGSAGAEIAVRVTNGLTIAVGAQAYIVRRAVDTQGTIDTNFIFPINIGLLYRIKEGKFQPYVGADAVFSQLLRDQSTGKNYFAAGGRVRGGFDYFFVPQVGINLDIGLGVLAGEKWKEVDSRLNPIGFYPTGTVGFTFAF